MKQKILIVIGAFLLVIAMSVSATLSIRRIVVSKQVEQKTINDSIVLLNRLLIQENQRYISVMVALDSISRKGETLPFTNFKGKTFELKLIEK